MRLDTSAITDALQGKEKAIIAALATLVTGVFTSVKADPLLTTLIIVSFVDTVSGHLKAFLLGQVISKKFARGAGKLAMYTTIGLLLRQIAHVSETAAMIVGPIGIAFVAQDLISILENFQAINISARLGIRGLDTMVSLLQLNVAKIMAEAETAAANSIAAKIAAKKAAKEADEPPVPVGGQGG